MAAGQSDYERGTMGVDGHKKTFGGFMGYTVYGGAAVALIVIFPTLVFGVHMGWFSSLIVTLVIGVILGLALKLKGGWYAGMIASAVPVAVASAIIAAMHG
jgi:hypothetical protein